MREIADKLELWAATGERGAIGTVVETRLEGAEGALRRVEREGGPLPRSGRHRGIGDSRCGPVRARRRALDQSAGDCCGRGPARGSGSGRERATRASGASGLVKRELFDEVRRLRGDQGARGLLAASGVHEVELGSPGHLKDVDTRDDLVDARRKAEGKV